jgi:CHASE3 domain sensor protein
MLQSIFRRSFGVYIVLCISIFYLYTGVVNAAGISATSTLYEEYTGSNESTGSVLDQKAKHTADIEKYQERIKEIDAELISQANIKKEVVRTQQIQLQEEDLSDEEKEVKSQQHRSLLEQMNQEMSLLQSEKEELTNNINEKQEQIDFLTLTEKKKHELKLQSSLVNIQSVFRIILVVVATMIVGAILKYLSCKYTNNKKRRRTIRAMINNIISILIVLQILLFVLSDISYFLPILALTGTALAFGLRDFIVAFISWFFITSSRGYKIGDYIQIGDTKGYVSNISMLRTSLKEVGLLGFTGRVIIFTNKKTVESTLINFTKHSQYFWDEITLTCSTYKEAVTLEKKLTKQLKVFYDQYLEHALKQWKKSSEHPYPKYESEHTKFFCQKDNDSWKLTCRFVVSLQFLFEVRKELYRIEK